MVGAGGVVDGTCWDFFVSYAEADRAWAEWVAWQLEQAGFRVLVRAWDFVPGSNEQLGVHRGAAGARRMIVLLSASYTDLERGSVEWTAAYTLDTRGVEGRLVPVRIDESHPPGMFGPLVSVDLFGLSAAEARVRLIEEIGHVIAGDARPATPPDFPLADRPERPLTASRFPGATSGAAQATEGRSPVGPGQPVERLDNPFDFEVHEAIDAGARAAGLSALPAYVPRDHDEQLRDVVRRALGGTSAVAVLVGESSTGKTRACWEAVTSLPAGWRLWHPINPGRPEALLAGLPRVCPRTVVWLNEAHHYLRTPAPEVGERVAAGLRGLLRDQGRRPVLVLATVWREDWSALTAVPATGQPDPHAQARALLAGTAITVPGVFGATALDALRVAAESDPRLAEALTHAEQGQVAQYLAAAPALLERYHNVPPAARALVEAAMDARRLGHGLALPEALLESAAPGYLSDQEWDAVDDDWFDQALGDATARCKGARGMLTRIRPRQPSAGPTTYRLADYLEQHARITRRAHRAPASLWDALLAYVTDADALGLAGSAERRLLFRYAIPLYRRALDAGEWVAIYRLADLLRRRGDTDGAAEALRAHSDPSLGDSASFLACRLAALLKQCGDADGAVKVLRAHAEAGNEQAARELDDLLVERGDVDALRARADAQDWHAASKLADLLVERGDIDALRARTDTGDWHAANRLADLLTELGDTEGTIKILGAQADASAQSAVQLASLLADQGNIDEATEMLWTHGDTDWIAAVWLADLLVERGDTDAALNVLRPHADNWRSDEYEHIGRRLADLLVASGNIDELRERADAGDWYAATRLADLLVDAGDLDGLRTRANSGDWHAAGRLAEQGDVEGAIGALHVGADGGDTHAAVQLADILVERRDVETAIEVLRTALLQGSADTDHWDTDEDAFGSANCKLADLLAERGDVQALRSAAESGNSFAADRLVRLLLERGDFDGAIEVLQLLAGGGNVVAAAWLINLLAEHGDVDGLRARVDEGDWFAANRFPDLLAERGRRKDAEQLWRFGINPDGSIASEH
ncbi:MULTISPECIES: TIR domain-containing protein [unclassified Frankia]|uniref:TIR domain-containing protein n=1 Tax=unclassified Frankia TaxID=2632575 RepID=UPI002AD32FE5|nr:MULTISPECIES: TIR domain-containing protein [unclassified Frankia]